MAAKRVNSRKAEGPASLYMCADCEGKVRLVNGILKVLHLPLCPRDRRIRSRYPHLRGASKPKPESELVSV